MNRLCSILLTMNEVDVIEQWLNEHIHFFDKIVAIDNSDDGTREILERYSEVYILKQEDLISELAEDTIRQFAYIWLLENGLQVGDWIQLCHADEFLIHDPRMIMKLAEDCDSEVVWWQSLFFVPIQRSGEEQFDPTIDIHKRFQYWVKHMPTAPQHYRFRNPRPYREVRTLKVLPELIFDRLHACPNPVSRYDKKQHKLPSAPSFKHFGWRSVEHCQQKRIWNSSEREPFQRFGRIKKKIGEYQDLFHYSKQSLPIKFNSEHFDLSSKIFQEGCSLPLLRNRSLLPSLMKDEKPKVIEIGVFKGEYSRVWLSKLPLCQLWLVDLWDNRLGMKKSCCPEVYRVYCDVLKEFSRRENVHVLKFDSTKAAELFPDEFFDIVYIDADHRYEKAKADIIAWWPKVKIGGIYSGHDYSVPLRAKNSHLFGVDEAVHELFGSSFYVTGEKSYKSWYLIRSEEWPTSLLPV